MPEKAISKTVDNQEKKNPLSAGLIETVDTFVDECIRKQLAGHQLTVPFTPDRAQARELRFAKPPTTPTFL